MRITLEVTVGPHAGQSFAFRGHDSIVVGRSSEAHFRLPFKDKTLSRLHFLIEANPPRCRLTDMASTNGTFVNGRRVTTIDLNDGDEVRGGKTRIVVHFEAVEPESNAPTAPQAAPTLPLIGSLPTIRGHVVERELGRGGMGVVYRGRDEATGEVVAIKTILPAVAVASEALGRFLREAGVLRRLDHPNVLRFRSVGQSGGLPYLVMDYVDGPDAGSVVKREGPLPVPRAVDWACQALEALAYAHGLGYVHRDVKPRNLLIARDGPREAVRLADFGLARIYLDSPLSGLTLTGQLGGTGGFLAPEQITHFREARPPADQYALGATLYYLLTGARTHDFPPEVHRQLLMVLESDPAPILDRRPDLPAGLSEVIHRALARDPAARFADAKAFRDALRPFRAA
jgi:hypothetical protein